VAEKAATYLVQVLSHLQLVVLVVVVHMTVLVRLEHLDKEQAAGVPPKVVHTVAVAVVVLHRQAQTEPQPLVVMVVQERQTVLAVHPLLMQAEVAVALSIIILLVQEAQVVVVQAVREQVQPQQEHLVQRTLVVVVVVRALLRVLAHHISAVALAVQA
jgi:hypothetical protein